MGIKEYLKSEAAGERLPEFLYYAVGFGLISVVNIPLYVTTSIIPLIMGLGFFMTWLSMRIIRKDKARIRIRPPKHNERLGWIANGIGWLLLGAFYTWLHGRAGLFCFMLGAFFLFTELLSYRICSHAEEGSEDDRLANQ